MKKQELIEKWIAIATEANGRNEMVCALAPTNSDARIVTDLIKELTNAFIVDLRTIDTNQFPDNEANGVVFCGKCGKTK